MRLLTISLVILCLTVLTIPVMADTNVVTRSVTCTDPVNSEYNITLTAEGMDVCGIAETLPAGVEYTGTSEPAGHVRISGQIIAFALINQSAVTYSVHDTTGDIDGISGSWNDFLTERSGTVGDAAGAPAPSETDATPVNSSPGFGTAAALLSSGLAAALLRQRRAKQ